MSTFKVGDKVRYVRENAPNGCPSYGSIGTVLFVDRGSVGVCFPGFQNGHALGYLLPRGSTEGWNTNAENLKLVSRKDVEWPPKESKPKRYNDIEECFI